MERLHRRSGFSSTHEDHWKSFTDIFATMCLMFFFVLVVFGILSSHLNNLADERQAQLEKEQAELIAIRRSYTEQELELGRQRIENLNSEQRITMLLLELETLRGSARTSIESALSDVEAMVNQSVEMYQKIEEMVNRSGNIEATYDEDTGRLEISADILFDTNQYELTPENAVLVDQLGEIFFDIIDEYTTPENEEIAKFEYMEIVGHTDSNSTGSSNRELSSQRAASFINEILPDGSLQEARYGKYFKASAMSEFEPIEGTINNQTPEQMEANRRVEIRLVFDDRAVENTLNSIIESLSKTAEETDDIRYTPEDSN